VSARLLPHLTTARADTGLGSSDHAPGGSTVSDTRTEPADHSDVLADVDPVTREVALAMRAKGDSPLKILAATGLDEGELLQLMAHTPAAPASPYGTAVDELLAWGAQHPQAKVQRLAEQAGQALERLTAHRAADQAVAGHETEVANLKAQLARAEQALRDAKAGKTTSTAPAARAAGAGPSASGTGITQPADKTTRNAARAWANKHGHQVADRGSIPQHVLEAWHAAHPDTLAG
jgi:hypothetical protein